MSEQLPEPEKDEPMLSRGQYSRAVVSPSGELFETLAQMPNPVGRPSDFDPDYHPEHALGMAAEGYSYGMIASVFGVVIQTLYNWRDNHPEMAAIWPLLKSKRRAAIEFQALRNVKGENSSKTAHGMLAQMDRYDEDGEKQDGDEYLDPRVHKVENDEATAGALNSIADALAAQAGMTLKTRKGEDDAVS